MKRIASLFSIVLVLFIAISAISAEDAAAENYLTDIKVQYDGNDPGPRQEVGWYFVPFDLNYTVGGDYIYLGYQASEAYGAYGKGQPPITSINFFATEDSQEGPQYGWYHWDGHDLNHNAGGDWIYVEWNVNEPGLDPITDIAFKATPDAYVPYAGPGWEHVGCDLNRGAGGDYIFAYVCRKKYGCDPV
ncbi:MAG: hypothetical protein J7647_08130 [Cyanobacteria bacterium SBLK]|nr:hypothetical protein [Cyanobacteria bacterium SBLK]